MPNLKQHAITDYLRCKIIVTFRPGLMIGLLLALAAVSPPEPLLAVVRVTLPGALADVVAKSLLRALDMAAGAGDWNRSLRPTGDWGSSRNKHRGLLTLLDTSTFLI